MAHLYSRRLILFITTLILFGIVIVTLFFSWDLNHYRPQLERGLQQALGAEFKIDGDIRLSLQPTPGLNIEGLRIQDQVSNIASIKKVALSFSLRSLLQGKLQFDQISLEQGNFKLLSDRWPFPGKKPELHPAPSGSDPGWNILPGTVFKIIHSNIIYEDEKSPQHVIVNDLNIDISATEMHLPPANGNNLTNLAFQGQLKAAQIKTKWMEFDRVRSRISYDNYSLQLTDISSRLFQGDGYGDFSIELGREETNYQLNFKLVEMEVADSLGRLAKKALIEGPLSLYADLHWRGKSSKEMLNNLHGFIYLTANGMLLKNINLDKTINNFNQSQRFNLVDLGAYFFIGPMATLATKSYSFARITTPPGTDSSTIMQLVSNWKIENGIAIAEDVAFITQHNRLALQGRLDIVNSRYEDMMLAVLDKRGCAIISQKVTGPLKSPKIEPPEILTVLSAPVRDAMSTPQKLFSTKHCTAFYSGQLTHPGTVPK